ncbi:MAG: alanine racemase [Parvularculaceae bacterium]|nr:alanine racemase [Parvularculaceae bacterium]
MVRPLAELETPTLLLDEAKLDRNIVRMKARLAGFGVPLRPHIKTAKSRDVYARALPGAVGVTVSTLAEAEYAFDHGVANILYAVGMTPAKLDRALALRAKGADLTLTADSLEAARAIAAKGEAAHDRIPVVIEIDSDDHRAGVKPLSAAARDIAAYLQQSIGARFGGLMTHAGGSYACRSEAAIRDAAERERRAVVDTAAMLKADGAQSGIVSVGSTPTATFGARFDGVTEVRVGVYMFMDLVMAGLGVCGVDDIAISVLVSVIGRQPEKGWIITDGGWMALSRDRGTAAFPVDHGYGLVCDEAGRPIGDLIVVSCNQEHGIIARRGGGAVDPAAFPIGRLLRILPNHACATAAQFGAYDVIDGVGAVIARYPRIGGW